MKLLKLLFVGMITIWCISAFSEEQEYTKQYSQCMDQADGVTMSMLECINVETERQDAKLNSMYKAVMRQQEGVGKQRLQNAQRAWIKFRDANVEYYADPDGGTAATVTAASIHLEMTAQRARELENLK